MAINSAVIVRLLYGYCVVRVGKLCPPKPEAEEHAVEEVLEKILMQELKPPGVMLNGHSNKGDTQYIE